VSLPLETAQSRPGTNGGHPQSIAMIEFSRLPKPGFESLRARQVPRGTKTDGSRRTIPMVPQVRAAFEAQRTRAVEGFPWAFHSQLGNPMDAVNFTNRIWYPLLRNLGLKQRPPCQMRHTAATLMLAAGKNREWVANVLGHSTTGMRFRVYSRFVPNLTHNSPKP